MKKINLIERLFTDSHEKQTPQRAIRYAAMLIMFLTLGVGQMWAEAFWPYAGFYEVYMTYSYSRNNTNYTFYSSDNNSSQSQALGTLTADFKVTALYFKCYKNSNDWSNLCGGLMIYNTGSGDTEYQPTWTWTDKNTWHNDFQAHLWEISATGLTKTIASYNSGPSGNYTAQLSFKMWGSDDNGSDCGDNWWISNNSNNYKFTYSIAPPAVSSFTVTPQGAISGSGTSGDPYIVPYGGDLKLTMSGSQARSDANSTAKYYNTSNGSAWTTQAYKTVSNVTNTASASSVTIKMCYENNSTSSLKGAQSSKTVYYKAANAVPLYKFVVNTGVGIGNVCATDNTDYPQTVANEKLSTLIGGTLTARGNGSESNLKYNNNSFNFNGGTNFYLKVVTDSPLKTGDIIRYINSNSGSVAIRLTQNSSTKEIVLAGNSKSTIQFATVTSDFNGQTTFYIDRKSNTSYLEYFEILRSPYTITLNATTNGGTVSPTAMYFAASDPLLLPRATKSSNRFKGWYTGASNDVKVSDYYTATGTTTLYAQFDECTSSGTVYKFQVKTGLANNTKTEGDLNASNFMSALDGGTAVMTGTHAKIINTNAIDFADNGDYITVDLDCALQTGDTIITTISGSKSGIKITSTGSTTSLQNVSYGDNIKTTVPSGLNNYKTFRIYRQDSNCGGISYFEIKRPTKYTITYDKGENGTGTLAAGTKIHNADFTLSSNSTAFTRAGYTYDGWSTSDGGLKTYELGGTYSTNADVTLYPHWVAASSSHSVSAVTSTGTDTYGTVSAASTSVAESSTTTITASPATGYQVTNWAVSGTGASISPSGSSNSNTTTLTMGTADATVTVTFGLKDYDVDYNAPSNGSYTTKVASGSASSADKTAQMGQTVALVATPSSGYAFASWTITNTDTDADITSTLLAGAKSTTASTSFTMPAANISIVATFARLYTVTKGTHENGDFTISSTSAVAGTSITLTATPSDGYVFDHWTKSGTSITLGNANVSPTTFTMPSGNVTINAVFKATPNIYYYKDGDHYTGSTYKNPKGNTASGSDNVALTTPWKMCNACVTGVDSVVVTNGQYDNKGTHMNAYIKLAKGGDETKQNVIFYISAGYTAVISTKIGGYESNPSVTLKKYSGGSLGSDITKTTGYATVGGVATTENNFKEIRWSALEAGVYVLNVTSQNAYISEIDIQTTPKNYTITLNNQSATTGGTANIAVTFDATTNLTGTPAITVPEKTGYTFGGYYTATGGSGTQIIDEDGNVNASASDASYTYTSATKQWKYANNIELYAKWTANQYTITLEDYDPDTWGVYFLGDCEGRVDHFPVTYGNNSLDCTLDGESQPMKLPYDFNGWYSGEGGSGDQIVSAFGVFTTGSTAYTDGTGHWNYAGNPTIYAKWTLTLSGYSEIEAETGALYSAGTITFTYMSASTSAFTAATRTGYKLDGYYTAEDGDKVVNADGTLVAGVEDWTDEDGKWVYSSSTTPSLYTKWTPITYTVAFDKDNTSAYVYDAEGSMDPVAATYDEYVTMPANTFTREGYSFRGWSKTSGGTLFCLDEATSVKNLTSTDGATVTLYALWTGNTVTVSFNPREGRLLSCRSVELHVGDTYGSAVCTSSDLPEPEAPAGYVFTGWYTASVGGTQVTKTDKVTTTSDHTLYARYVKQERVYFKNTLDWENVFVTYDAYWDNEKGTGNWGKIYHKMTRIAGTDIYYDQVPAAILASWKGDIAFNSKELLDEDKHAPQAAGNFGNYNSGEVVYRMDFDTLATMFVPKNVNTNNTDGNYQKYSAQYISTGYADGTSSDPQYTSGYWRVFNDVVSGYVLTYEKNGTNSWCPGKSLNAEKVGDSVFVYTATLEANTQYNYNIIKTTKLNGKSDDFKYDQQINSGRCTDLKLLNQPGNGWMQTTVAGDYKFILTMKSDGHMYLSVEYPFAVNDYRVVYSYTKGSAQTFSSEYIKAKANAVDTISMFIHSGDSATSRSLYIQKCTTINGSGVPTWNTTYRAITLPSETASGKSSGVYNFVITQDGSAAATGECIGKYEGNYYIRCDAADGGWDHYKERADNQMTFSEYSLSQTLSAPFSHYYCKYVGSSSTDITYTVATDYSPMICPILVGDATIGGVGNKTLPSDNPASIRFTWNDETNGTFRSYLKSAQGDGNARFLVLHGSDNKVLDANGNTIAAAGAGAEDMKANELLFSDTENWVYELRFKAKPGAKVSIIARYNGYDRYLVGAADKWETIISGGTSSTMYDIAAVYDFKTNRLITTWVPSGTISETIEEVDVLIERHNQDGATTITFGKAAVDEEAGSISAKRVIAALRFDYDELVGRVAAWTPDTRAKMMFFVSFPFDVNVSDIFGLNSTYGQAFIVQKYDGAERAEKGFFLGDGTETFWKILPVDSVMHAGVGYVVTMDNDYLNGDVGHVWDNKRSGDHVYLYFPSANTSNITINSDDKTITVPAHKCNINKTFGKLNHKYTDSNWNLMGVPIFQNHTGNAESGTPGAIFTPTEAPEDTTAYIDHPDLGYFYEWNTSKTYTIRSAVGYTFKPMHCYMVQYTGNVKFTCATPAVVAAPRRVLSNENYNIELQVLNSNEEMLDHTYVELRENAVDSFALNEDTYMMQSNKAVNIYTFAGDYDVAANVMSIGSHVVPVGVIVNRAGTYTFSMPSSFSGTVTLIDTYTGVRTNLALSDYEVNLTQGTDEERFLLEININNAPTAIDGVGDGEGNLKDGKAHKFIMNDQMYILQNGIIYDARGARVK